MIAPEKIYCGNNGHGNLSYSREKVYPSMEEYIRKDSILEWAKEKLDKSYDGNTDFDYGLAYAYTCLIEKLEEL